MRQGKISSKALAALLAILMVLSVVVALPAAAEETAPATTEKVLYSLDMSKAGALDATATAAWLAANNGFATTTTTTNTIDADGFYKIAQSNRVISNGAPSDFINLLAGWYPGYDTPGKTYEISMDLRIDKADGYVRPSSSADYFKYVDESGNEYTTLYTDESGWSFFAARVGGNYDSLFRIGAIDGQAYLFAESATGTVNASNYKELGNVYVKDADGNKIYVAEDGGALTGADTGKFGLAFIIDPENAYAIEKDSVYSLRIVYELGKYTGAETAIKAHLYVKGEGDAEETYLGYSDWSSKTGSAANGFRLSDAGGYVSFANVKVTVDEPATVVWSADLSKFGASSNGNATNTNLKNGYAANVFALAGQTLASSTIGGSAKFVDGLFNGGSNGTSIKADGSYSPFGDLLTGNFLYKGEKLTSTFIEFDYKLGTDFSYSGRSDSATVAGTNYTIVTDYAANGGGTYNLRFRSNNKNDYQLFRISPNGYLFTTDLESTVTSTATGVDGYFYYMDGENKVYFDAEGYRYTLNGDAKNYIDDTSAAAPAVSGLSIIGCANPATIAQAYMLTKGETYRVGVKNVVESVSGGISTIKQTVYIKAPGDTEWTLVGTSTQYWYDETAYGSNANYQIIWPAGTGNMMFGGNMVAYACVDGQHVDGYTTTETVLSDTGFLIEKTSCTLCGKSTAKKDGVFYTSQAVAPSACEDSYTLWTATNGSGKTFITDVTEGSHSYATTDGLCSKCNTYVYMPNIAKRTGTSLAIASDLDNKPVYDSTTQTIKAPNGGMALCFPVNTLNPRSPFIMTLEFKLTAAIENNTSKNNAWPLLSYQVGNGTASVLAEYVGVHVVDDQLKLMLGTYTNRPIATIEYDTWYTLQVAVVPDSDENIKYNNNGDPYSTSDARIYLNGEQIGEKYDFSFVYDVAQTGNVRVGVQTAQSYYRFGWEARYVDFQQTDLAGAYTLQNSNEVINLRYDRYQTASPSHSNARPNMGTTLSAFRETEVVGGKYGILSTAGYKTMSLSTLLASGEEFGVSGKKYEINVKFAVPDTDADGDGVVDALPKGTQNLVRLSKYGDSIQSTLLAYRSWGQIYANGRDLYTSAGDQINILREFDENGVPTSILDLRVVVDEKNNTYSVYADGKVTYYWESGEVGVGRFLPAINLTMPLNQNGGTGKTTYGSITMADAAAANITGTYQYVRFFREIATTAVEEISVALIPDSDVELIGTQVKTADQTETNGFDLRFVFGIDDVYANAVNFDIKAYKNGEYIGKQETSATSVFTGVNAGNSTIYAYQCTEGDYLAAVKVLGVTETTADDIYTFEITAYLVDGTTTTTAKTYTVSCNGLGGNVRTVAK